MEKVLLIIYVRFLPLKVIFHQGKKRNKFKSINFFKIFSINSKGIKK